MIRVKRSGLGAIGLRVGGLRFMVKGPNVGMQSAGLCNTVCISCKPI